MMAASRNRLVTESIAHHLLPKGKERDQDFWNQHWPLIRIIGSLSAILGERRYYFEKKLSRVDAWALISVVDLCWQTVRTLAGKSGLDRKWLQAYLPANHRQLFPQGSALSFVTDEEIVEDIMWVYGLNSALRHPGTNSATIDQMLNDPWPPDLAQRLGRAAEAADRILMHFEAVFSPNTGFEGDIDEKRKLAANAQRHHGGAA